MLLKLKSLVLLVALLLMAVTSASATESDYSVGDGDVLKLSVYDNPDLTTTVRVSSAGSIQFPLIGKVQVEGMTVAEVSDTIARALADGYIINPQVSVFIEEFRSQKVTIMGEVAKPGLYELSGQTSLLELISKAGGLTKEAGDLAAVQSNRADGSHGKVHQVNLKQLLEEGQSSLDVPLSHGDSVFIPQAGMVYVTGEVKDPDSYKIDEGTTVIMAVTKAGGFTNLAAKGRVKVIRKLGDQEQVFEKVPMNMLVQPDDVVVVPESFF